MNSQQENSPAFRDLYLIFKFIFPAGLFNANIKLIYENNKII